MSAAVHIDISPVLVILFGMPGCEHCDAFVPRFRAAAARHPEVTAYAVDSSVQEDAANRYKVRVLPTTVVLSFGRQVERIEGAKSEREAERLFAAAERLLGNA
jgi:thioredoxin-like negative regulator of GroEL